MVADIEWLPCKPCWEVEGCEGRESEKSETCVYVYVYESVCVHAYMHDLALESVPSAFIGHQKSLYIFMDEKKKSLKAEQHLQTSSKRVLLQSVSAAFAQCLRTHARTSARARMRACVRIYKHVAAVGVAREC